jgi:hypothetical protein
VYTLAETPALRQDNENDGVFHCFARSGEEAELIGRQHFEKTWKKAQVI